MSSLAITVDAEDIQSIESVDSTVGAENKLPSPQIEEVEPLSVWRWTRALYYKAAETGVFNEGERLELINGQVYRKVSPQNRPHALSVTLSARVLEKVFRDKFHVQREQPIVLSEDNEPEPDIAVIKGLPEDYQNDHPTSLDVILMMEVSDSTYMKDARFKASLYASFDLPDYWVLNVNKRWLEVRRDPAPDPEARFGYSYMAVKRYLENEKVEPLGASGKSVTVRDLLPLLPVKEASVDADDTE